MNREIIGTWNLDPEDINAQRIYGNVSIDFKSTGELVYTIHSKEGEQKMFMTYEVNGNILITDQLSHSNKEETEFRMLPDGKLELYFGGIASRYIKISK